MRLLPVPTILDQRHDDILRSHERQLLGDPPSNDHRIHNQSLRDILQRRQNDISCQESFWERDSSVRTR